MPNGIQTKILPGAYTKVVDVPVRELNPDTKGILSIPVVSSWGEELAVQHIYKSDMYTEAFTQKTGLLSTDPEAVIYWHIFNYINVLDQFRVNYGGTKAQATNGTFKVEAINPGIRGNDISVTVTAVPPSESYYKEPVIDKSEPANNDIGFDSSVTTIKVTYDVPIKINNSLLKVTLNGSIVEAVVDSTDADTLDITVALEDNTEYLLSVPAGYIIGTEDDNQKATTIGYIIKFSTGQSISDPLPNYVPPDQDPTIFQMPSTVISTFYRDVLVDVQQVSVATDIEPNAYVVFTVSDPIAPNAGLMLAGGTDGKNVNYDAYFDTVSQTIFDVVAIPEYDSSILSSAYTFIKKMINDFGKTMQLVIPDYPDADYEYVIKTKNQGYICSDGIIDPLKFVAQLGSMMAGASPTESFTGFNLYLSDGATEIINPLSKADIEKNVLKGYFLLDKNTAGFVSCVKDIDSLHTMQPGKSYSLTKNRVIRETDRLIRDVKIIWESEFQGKVTNDDIGRATFKSKVSILVSEYVAMGAFKAVDQQNDIKVSQGDTIDQVLLELYLTPYDSMEQLYFLVVI